MVNSMGGRRRACEIGITIGSLEAGRLNAITDVEGVGVGHSTIIRGEGPLKIGEGPVRTGVTAIVPHQGNPYDEKVVAAVDVFNAYGKSVGLLQIAHMGTIETPILLTDTLNTWIVADCLVSYMYEIYGVNAPSINPVVGETNGSFLNDSIGRHVRRNHVFEALDMARSPEGMGVVPEGNVGGGTPMSAFGFKGGIGTASRKTDYFTLGILVQLNCGRMEDLRVDGVPVGKELIGTHTQGSDARGSVIIIMATDLELTSRQLWKVLRRTFLGIARLGHYGNVGSGDYAIGFTTSRRSLQEAFRIPRVEKGRFLREEGYLDLVFRAAVEATEEAALNALFMAETMVGRDFNKREGIPIDRVLEILKKYGRL
ncbi:P1 family peptidase [Candidatus Bathyarchaeota archaeon]|nr:P1 family peptidase [Candidatus Bathyarchaeota archaeon]